MHTHGTAQSAAACSRFCLANYQDIAYYQKHRHYQNEAPVPGCWACDEQKRKAEEKRKEQQAWQR